MKRPRTDYTLEFRQEAVRLVHGGQRQADVALGFLREKVPRNWWRFRSSVTDNFRVINPKNFRVVN